ncbi:MAG: efflux RND transporter periplasmic adaptor subunit, partial [Candidatus Acidiferrales bacterium]
MQTAEEPATIAVTRWTEKTELFMEYPPLVAGEKARFAVHLTDLSDFTPLTAGQVVIELRSPGGSVKTFSTDAPSRPGIFGVDVLPSEPGTYSMTVQLDSPNLKDVHELGAVAVYADITQVETASSEEVEEAISFLKEQQWTLEFATDTATEYSLRESLRVPAEVQPRTGGEAEVSAPVAGRISAANPIPAVGTSVARGRTLASLIPRTGSPADRATLEFAVAEATHELERSRKDRGRVERLFTAG